MRKIQTAEDERPANREPVLLNRVSNEGEKDVYSERRAPRKERTCSLEEVLKEERMRRR